MLSGMLHMMENKAQQACVAFEKALAFDPLNSQCRQLFECACSCFADVLSVCSMQRCQLSVRSMQRCQLSVRSMQRCQLSVRPCRGASCLFVPCRGASYPFDNCCACPHYGTQQMLLKSERGIEQTRVITPRTMIRTTATAVGRREAATMRRPAAMTMRGTTTMTV